MRYRVVTTYLMYLLLVPSLAQELRARVVGGTAEGGRLEIFYNGTWNTVCDDEFGKEEALVACRMLGFNSTTAVHVGSGKYGAGSGPILFSNLQCVGNETSLAQCKHPGLYRHYCGHSEDVGIMCNMTQELRARVVGGTAEAGRLEIFHDGAWNTVCEDGFGQEEALVACRMLGFKSTTAVAVGTAKYGAGSGPILFSNLQCVGNETSLAQCKHPVLYTHNCGHRQDVGVMCNITQELRARVVGGTAVEGRLEIFYDGTWNTVCQDGFGLEEALVACRMLGLNSSVVVTRSNQANMVTCVSCTCSVTEDTTAAPMWFSKYGAGSGPILFSDLQCVGNETSLAQCKHPGLYRHYCDHWWDVGVACINTQMAARLADGTSEAGRLEIFFNGEWGKVCDRNFGKKEAHVACRMLGFSSTGAAAISSVKYGAGAGPTLLVFVKCQGTESSLAQCEFILEHASHCLFTWDVGVICNITDQMTARLAGGTSQAGRLEIFFNGEWSTVCDDQFGQEEAEVACRMLQFNSSGAAAVSSRRYGQGSGHILLNNLNCRGTETTLEQCQHDPLYTNDCDHSKDVGVVCNITQQMSARVVDGTSDAGRLEILFNREWSTVCNTGVGQREADVACRMLGFHSNGAVAVSSTRYGHGSGHILLQNVKCQGNEKSLKDCRHNMLYDGNCSHSEDLGIICNISEPMTARLVNGTSEAGRLEIFFNREWSPVCGVNFGKNEARVSCKMLGFNSTGAVAVSSDRYGQGTGSVLDVGRCVGTEDSLVPCIQPVFYISDCDQDASIICNITRDKIRLTGLPRTKLNMGRVEMKDGSEWQSVCVSDDKTARVICQELGFSRSTGVLLEGWPPEARQTDLLKTTFACSGDESSVFDCHQTSFGLENVCLNSDVDCSESPTVYIMPERETYPMTEGKSVVLKCWILYKYQPAYDYTWIETANGQPSGADLIFDHLTRSHNGLRVKCTATFTVAGEHLRVSSDPLVLKVYYKPLIRVTCNDSETTSQQNDTQDAFIITPGANITFWCEADSNPPPDSITWSGRVNSSTGELQITAANNNRHTGVYTCTVVTQTVDEEEKPFSLKSSHQITVVVEGREKAEFLGLTSQTVHSSRRSITAMTVYCWLPVHE